MIVEIALAGIVGYFALIVPVVVLDIAMDDDWDTVKVFHVAFLVTLPLVYWIAFVGWVVKKVLDIAV